jgi:hypothetical protein
MNVFDYISDLIGSKDSNTTGHDEDEQEKKRSLSVGGHPAKRNPNLKRKAFWSRGERKEKDGVKEGEEISSKADDALLQNPLNELQILMGHSDIVRLMHKIDDFKYTSLPIIFPFIELF